MSRGFAIPTFEILGILAAKSAILGTGPAIISAYAVLPYLGDCATTLLALAITERESDFQFSYIKGGVVSAACLLGLTTLAARINLIGGGLSLAGAGALIVTTVVSVVATKLLCNS